MGEGLMVQCPDKGEACIIAESKAKELNRCLQNITPMVLLRENTQCWFFPFTID
jgi:hypothetical protein